MQYVMNADHTVEKMEDIVEWQRRFEIDDPQVARDVVGRSLVTTIFLGIPVGENRQGRPLLFQTTVLKGPMDGTTHTYATHAEAVVGHGATVSEVKASQA